MENNVLELFFNESSKQWHFEEILKQSKLSRSKVNNWLKRFQKENLIKKIKEVNKMPYYIADFESPNYKNKKKLFAMEKFYNSGFLNHLLTLKGAKTIILFGSFSRSDWHKDSDIDLFIYGNADDLNLAEYELKLKKEIQLFNYNSKKELNRLGSGLIKNIIKGNIIKGDLDFIEVNANA